MAGPTEKKHRGWILWLLVCFGSSAGGLMALANDPSGAESAKRILRVTGDHDYPPYCFLDNGIPSGFDIDIIRALASVLGIELRIELKPWREARNLLDTGRADVIPGMARIPAREEDYAFSTPIKQLSFDLFVPSGSPIKKLADAHAAALLVQKAGVMYDLILQQAVLTNLVAVDDAPDAIRLLAGGSYDGAVVNRVQALYLINQSGLRNIESLNVSLPTIPYCLAVRAGENDLIDLLNEGLSILKADGSYDRIYAEWFGIYTHHPYHRYFRVALIGAALVTALLILLALLNRSLRRQVQRRTDELRQVINSIPHPIFVRDAAGRYLVANQATAAAMGLNLAEIIGQKHQDLYPDDPRTSKFLREDQQVFESGQAVKIPESEVIDHAGRKHLLQVSKLPLRMINDQPSSILCVAVDITELKQAEEAVRSSRENLMTILNSIGDGVIAVDRRQIITRINPVALQLTGWTEPEAMGRLLGEVLTLNSLEGEPLDIEAVIGRALQDMEHGGMSRHIVLASRHGRSGDVSLQWSPIRDPRQAVVGLVLVLRDVTEENRFNQRLQEIQKMESIGRLAGGVAHDFNNLLTGIMGYTELLGITLENQPECRVYLKGILEASERARDLVQQLLTFSRRQPGDIKPINLHTVIGHVSSLLQHTMDRRIVILCHLNAACSTILGDRSQLQNAILNLGINSRDAMPTGGSLTLVTENRVLDVAEADTRSFALLPGTYLVLRITDTGVGMDRETLTHIFEPFYTTKGKTGGVGLGLAAVYGTVNEHGGYIEVTSKPGQGTTFELGFPVHAVAAPDDDNLMNLPDRRGSGCILIVDDEPIVLKTVKDILLSLGYRTLTAVNGREALSVYTTHRDAIDLVILDMIMPEMNGEETLRELKRINPRVKVIICSGFLQDYHITELKKIGLLDVLQKPFRKSTLAAKIDAALNDQPPPPA